MKVAVFIVALIACASATSLFTQFPMDFSKRRSILAVLTQVETQLKMGGPLDAITKALDDFKNAIEEEQATHDALKDKQDQECEEEFKLREEAVAEAESALKEATETLDGCKAQKVRADGDLAITKKQLAENQQFLINAVNARQKEHYEFETLQGKHEQVVAAIDAAINYINDFAASEQKSASFAQLTKHANKILIMAVQIQTVHHMGPALSALAQLGTQEESDDAFIEELKNIFRKFR
jgi:septal ring factor EnvC (AmiA/AmiB activator)